mgnify:CR=1 FL=1
MMMLKKYINVNCFLTICEIDDMQAIIKNNKISKFCNGSPAITKMLKFTKFATANLQAEQTFFLSLIQRGHASGNKSSPITYCASWRSPLAIAMRFGRCAFRRRKRHAHEDSWRRRAGSGEWENLKQERANRIPGLPVVIGPPLDGARQVEAGLPL